MSYAPPTNSWFLTGVDLYRRDSESASSSDAEDNLEPLKEFRCPPLPKIAKKTPYFSLENTDKSTRQTMSEWEKKAIISRLQKPTPVDEQAFQTRLSTSSKRNTNSHIREVQERAAEVKADAEKQLEDVFEFEEIKREQIFFKHKNLVQIRKMEKFVARAQAWYSIIVSHVFLTALMKERRRQEALDTFGHLMAPMVRRYVALKRHKAEKEALLQKNLKDIPYPSPEVIQSMYGTFFSGWPPHLLEQLGAKAKPMFLPKGSYLMHEGDIGRVMFMITKGSVSIILRKKGKDKRRTKANSNGVFEIKAPCYVGEFALVCKEPRSASIFCETDIGFWAVLPEDYEDVAVHLSPEVASKQREATDVRRRQNLKKFFPLKIDFLRKFAYFEKFSDESLNQLIESVEPIVLHDGDFLFEKGKIDTAVYFIQDGTATSVNEDGEKQKVSTGSCVGMFECSCGVNEQKRISIISVNYCDVWRMKREMLLDIGLSEPQALLHCRAAAKQDRALEIRKKAQVPSYIQADPYLSFCLLPAHLAKFYEACKPAIFLNGERLSLMGQPLDSFVVIVNGTVDVTVAVSGEQTTFRVSTASRKDDEPVSKALFKEMKGLTYVVGAYEFAAGMRQNTSTFSSFGLTEAFVISKEKLEALLSPELRNIIQNNTAGRDVINRTYRSRDIGYLNANLASSYVNAYKQVKEKTKEKGKKNM